VTKKNSREPSKANRVERDIAARPEAAPRLTKAEIYSLGNDGNKGWELVWGENGDFEERLVLPGSALFRPVRFDVDVDVLFEPDEGAGVMVRRSEGTGLKRLTRPELLALRTSLGGLEQEGDGQIMFEIARPCCSGSEGDDA
jgi:hypothetical protein